VGSEAKIVELLTERYGLDSARISPEARMTDLGLDSLTMAELMCDIEEAFDIEIDLDETKIETFGEAVDLVDRLVESKGA